MDLRGQVALLWRWAWLIALLAIGAGLIGYSYSSVQPKLYQAQATLIVGRSLSAISLEYNALLASQGLSQTYAAVATMRPLLQRVADVEGGTVTAEDLQSRIIAVAPRDSTLLTITVSDSRPDRAARLANAVAAELITLSPTIQGQHLEVQDFTDQQIADTRADITTTQAAIDELLAQATRTAADLQDLQVLQNRLAGLRAAFNNLLDFSSLQSANALTLIDPATTPSEPAAPRILVNTFLSAGLGVLVALLLIFGLEYLDDRIRDVQDAEAATGARVAGLIPSRPGRSNADHDLPTVHAPRSTTAEAFRTLRTNLEFGRTEVPLRRTLITSAGADEGKTMIAANLAVALAADRQTLLIDADLRNPRLHEVFQLSNAQGLTTILTSDGFDPSRFIQESGVRGLRVLTTGPLPPTAGDLIGSRRLRELIRYMDGLADAVVIDGPQINGFADVPILTTLVDRTLFVVRVGRTRRAAAAQAVQALSRVDAGPIGLILNGQFRSPRDATYARVRSQPAEKVSSQRQGET
ncbi:MAG: polysaccharide biosynthesis tyrosine autokinase [Chloroflexi bacterium]|nr:polysaccharide biosynthesis tyrosine autokinase [Chloroflexota bacterium]